jgi:hypothetical protein
MNTPSLIAQLGDERAKKRAHEIEAKRLLALISEAGIPEDMLDASEQIMADMVVDNWQKCNRLASDIIAYISIQSKKWARSGTYLTIEGGGRFGEKQRDKIMHYCLLKAIIANFNDITVDKESYTSSGEVIRTYMTATTKVIDYLSVMPMLSSFESERFSILNNLSRIPLLAIREIDPSRTPRVNSDAAAITDSILRQRRISKLPTILTFLGNSLDMAKLGNNHSKEIVDIAVADHSEENEIIRIMIKG